METTDQTLPETSDSPDAPIDHIGVDIWLAFRAYENAMFDMVVDLGFPDISVTDSEILVLIGENGTRLVDIARGRRISKQAAHEQIQSLIRRDYLRTEVDPQDKRSKRICYTQKGCLLSKRLRGVKSALHDKVAMAIGHDGISTLRSLLDQTKKAVL